MYGFWPSLPEDATTTTPAATFAESDAALAGLMDLSLQENADRAQQARVRAARLVRQAISQSPSVREARLAADAALQEVDYARAGRLPQVSVGAKSTVNTADSQSLLKSDGTPMATLNADMPLYDWGRVDAAVKGREAAVGSAQAAPFDRLTTAIARLNQLGQITAMLPGQVQPQALGQLTIGLLG